MIFQTYCVDAQIPDSACTATAYLCGVKNNYGTIGISAAVSRNDCEAAQNPANQVESIADWALSDGRDVGECQGQCKKIVSYLNELQIIGIVQES